MLQLIHSQFCRFCKQIFAVEILRYETLYYKLSYKKKIIMYGLFESLGKPFLVKKFIEILEINILTRMFQLFSIGA